jgi:PIN like domain
VRLLAFCDSVYKQPVERRFDAYGAPMQTSSTAILFTSESEGLSMRAIFPGYFRSSDDEFTQLWTDCIIALDADVLLNLYRYSHGTHSEPEKALTSVEERLFLPHQAARSSWAHGVAGLTNCNLNERRFKSRSPNTPLVSSTNTLATSGRPVHLRPEQ